MTNAVSSFLFNISRQFNFDSESIRAQMDRNSDGAITRAEFDTFIRSNSNPGEYSNSDITAVFNMFDKNKKGVIKDTNIAECNALSEKEQNRIDANVQIYGTLNGWLEEALNNDENLNNYINNNGQILTRAGVICKAFEIILPRVNTNNVNAVNQFIADNNAVKFLKQAIAAIYADADMETFNGHIAAQIESDYPGLENDSHIQQLLSNFYNSIDENTNVFYLWNHVDDIIRKYVNDAKAGTQTYTLHNDGVDGFNINSYTYHGSKLSNLQVARLVGKLESILNDNNTKTQISQNINPAFLENLDETLENFLNMKEEEWANSSGDFNSLLHSLTKDSVVTYITTHAPIRNAKQANKIQNYANGLSDLTFVEPSSDNGWNVIREGTADQKRITKSLFYNLGFKWGDSASLKAFMTSPSGYKGQVLAAYYAITDNPEKYGISDLDHCSDLEMEYAIERYMVVNLPSILATQGYSVSKTGEHTLRSAIKIAESTVAGYSGYNLETARAAAKMCVEYVRNHYTGVQSKLAELGLDSLSKINSYSAADLQGLLTQLQDYIESGAAEVIYNGNIDDYQPLTDKNLKLVDAVDIDSNQSFGCNLLLKGYPDFKSNFQTQILDKLSYVEGFGYTRDRWNKALATLESFYGRILAALIGSNPTATTNTCQNYTIHFDNQVTGMTEQSATVTPFVYINDKQTGNWGSFYCTGANEAYQSSNCGIGIVYAPGTYENEPKIYIKIDSTKVLQIFKNLLRDGSLGI